MARLGFACSGGLAPADAVACMVEAERLGYDSAWMAEGHGGDQFALLSAAAVQTRRISLGTAISSVFVRSAPTVAMAAVTLHELSGGRCVLGLGSSHRVQVGPEHGVEFSRPTDRLRDYVRLARTLFADGVVEDFRGATFDVERFDLWFEQRARVIPIYIAGLFPRMLEICGEIADGVLLTRTPLADCARIRERVEAGARRAGRPAGSAQLASLLPTHVDVSQQAAFDALRPGVAFYAGFFPRYNRLLAQAGFERPMAALAAAWARGEREQAVALIPDELIDRTCVAGTAEQCRTRLRAYADAGLDQPLVGVRSPDRAAVMATLAGCAGALD